MTDATVVLVLLGLGTYALKAAGPVLIGGRALPVWISRLADLAPAALLAALIVSSTAVTNAELTFDARIVGLIAAGVALRLKAPFVVVIVIAAAATALTRSLR
ncbi:MAG TPA: AzlD domain-containing protein [Acidimicrobiia bacterium]|nr:AzlD domain-containing protein [Acidimicrobiia bacterium]